MTAIHDTSLVGRWRKTASPACAARYPEELRFDANGIYAGQAQLPGEFTWWDSGTWKLVQQDELALSVANDAVEHYACRLDGEVLTLTDKLGCSFVYERES